MPVIGLGIAVLILFLVLSALAERGYEWARLGAISEILILLVLSPMALLGGIGVLILYCDENCEPDAGSWQDLTAPWELYGQLAFVIIGVVLLVVSLALLLRDRFRTASAAMLLAGAFFAAWAVVIAPEGNRFGI